MQHTEGIERSSFMTDTVGTTWTRVDSAHIISKAKVGRMFFRVLSMAKLLDFSGSINEKHMQIYLRCTKAENEDPTCF